MLNLFGFFSSLLTVGQAALFRKKKKSPELVHSQELLNQNFKLLQIKELQLRSNFFS